jgi:isoquinoline 1-oxidoreductase beta subunit
VSFGVVAGDAAKLDPPADVKLKAPGEWKLAGTPRRRLDIHDKVTARTVYAIDVRLPNMLHAAIVQCPVFGGTLKSVDESSIAAKPGVRGVVRMTDAVAVVADSWWRAKRAADDLRVTWDDRGNGALSTAAIADFVRNGLDSSEAQVGRADGDAAAALERAATPHRSGLRGAVSRARHHGAADLHRPCAARPRRDLGADPGSGDGDGHRRARRWCAQ